jgi:hypothetical protein
MDVRKFILAECGDGDCHLVPIDQIKSISPRGEGRNGLTTKITLLSDQLLYTTDSPRVLHDKILKAQRAK